MTFSPSSKWDLLVLTIVDVSLAEWQRVGKLGANPKTQQDALRRGALAAVGWKFARKRGVLYALPPPAAAERL